MNILLDFLPTLVFVLFLLSLALLAANYVRTLHLHPIDHRNDVWCSSWTPDLAVMRKPDHVDMRRPSFPSPPLQKTVMNLTSAGNHPALSKLSSDTSLTLFPGSPVSPSLYILDISRKVQKPCVSTTSNSNFPYTPSVCLSNILFVRWTNPTVKRSQYKQDGSVTSHPRSCTSQQLIPYGPAMSCAALTYATGRPPNPKSLQFIPYRPSAQCAALTYTIGHPHRSTSPQLIPYRPASSFSMLTHVRRKPVHVATLRSDRMLLVEGGSNTASVLLGQTLEIDIRPCKALVDNNSGELITYIGYGQLKSCFALPPPPSLSHTSATLSSHLSRPSKHITLPPRGFTIVGKRALVKDNMTSGAERVMFWRACMVQTESDGSGLRFSPDQMRLKKAGKRDVSVLGLKNCMSESIVECVTSDGMSMERMQDINGTRSSLKSRVGSGSVVSYGGTPLLRNGLEEEGECTRGEGRVTTSRKLGQSLVVAEAKRSIQGVSGLCGVAALAWRNEARGGLGEACRMRGKMNGGHDGRECEVMVKLGNGVWCRAVEHR